MTDETWKKFRTGEIDINDQELFLSVFLKGLLFDLNRHLTLRGVNIPHYILNTGDDILYLEAKGYDFSKEPQDNTNEDYIYNVIPRCLVQPSGINILTDQLTSPYTTGKFELEYGDNIYSFIAEFRRLPIKMSVTLKYLFDNFSDTLNASQQIMSKMAFINNYYFNYLGNTIEGSYLIPADINPEMTMEFDGLSSDSKTRNITLDIEVETNIPIVQPRTLIPSDRFIREMHHTHEFHGNEKHSHPRPEDKKDNEDNEAEQV